MEIYTFNHMHSVLVGQRTAEYAQIIVRAGRAEFHAFRKHRQWSFGRKANGMASSFVGDFLQLVPFERFRFGFFLDDRTSN